MSTRSFTKFCEPVWSTVVPTKVKFPWALTEHHAIKAYWESGDTAPRILNLGTRLRWVVTFTSRPLYSQGKNLWYPLYRRLGGPQSRSVHGDEEAAGNRTPDHPARSPALYRWAIPAPPSPFIKYGSQAKYTVVGRGLTTEVTVLVPFPTWASASISWKPRCLNSSGIKYVEFLPYAPIPFHSVVLHSNSFWCAVQRFLATVITGDFRPAEFNSPSRSPRSRFNAQDCGPHSEAPASIWPYGLDDRGYRVRFPARAGNFPLYRRVQIGSGAHQPPIQWVPGVLSLGIKRPGREADHSPPCSAKVKNAWRYTSTFTSKTVFQRQLLAIK
jgi:hypothetical protein